MTFELYDGSFVGTATWAGPRRVELHVDDAERRRFFERFFSQEDSVMGGPMGFETMSAGRRDESEENFKRAMFHLPAYHYEARPADGAT